MSRTPERCPKCGSGNIIGYEGEWECMDCGYKFTETIGTTKRIKPNYISPPSPPKKGGSGSSRTWVLILLLILAILGWLFWIGCSVGCSLETAVLRKLNQDLEIENQVLKEQVATLSEISYKYEQLNFSCSILKSSYESLKDEYNSALEKRRECESNYFKLEQRYNELIKKYEKLNNSYQDLTKAYEVAKSASWVSPDKSLEVAATLIEKYYAKLNISVRNLRNEPIKEVLVVVFYWTKDGYLGARSATIENLYPGESNNVIVELTYLTNLEKYQVVAVWR